MDLPSWFVDSLATWTEHPAQMARELFGFEPDRWQEEALEKFPTSKRMCLKACAGPGKTAVLGLLGWNFLITRPHPMVGATSVSGDNLKANLWTEAARLRGRAPLLEVLFEQTKTAIYSREFPETWKMEARTWAKDADANQIGNALRGVHADYVMWLLDETGDYPDAIMPICETIFAGSPIEAHIVQAGNPLKRSGPLYRAAVTSRELWTLIEITADPDDPNRTPRVSVEHAREMIATYGRDNPWILFTIFGQFPPSSFNALIGHDEVAASMKRYYREDEIGNAAKVLGVDVARFGDDQSVIAPRWGLQMMPLVKKRNINSVQGAGLVARHWQDWGADACFVDDTGGYGSGWIDQLQTLGRSPIGVAFSGQAHDSQRFYNKRSEMAFDLVAWIKRGGALPEDASLLAALVETTYTFKGDAFLLEPKELVKKKLMGRSPDEMDAAMLTFAEPVSPKELIRLPPKPLADYDPYAGLNAALAKGAGDYDPYRGM
jgi:hypothetical protein